MAFEAARRGSQACGQLRKDKKTCARCGVLRALPRRRDVGCSRKRQCAISPRQSRQRQDRQSQGSEAEKEEGEGPKRAHGLMMRSRWSRSPPDSADDQAQALAAPVGWPRASRCTRSVAKSGKRSGGLCSRRKADCTGPAQDGFARAVGAVAAPKYLPRTLQASRRGASDLRAEGRSGRRCPSSSKAALLEQTVCCVLVNKLKWPRRPTTAMGRTSTTDDSRRLPRATPEQAVVAAGFTRARAGSRGRPPRSPAPDGRGAPRRPRRPTRLPRPTQDRVCSMTGVANSKRARSAWVSRVGPPEQGPGEGPRKGVRYGAYTGRCRAVPEGCCPASKEIDAILGQPRTTSCATRWKPIRVDAVAAIRNDCV
jgi:hypothetical protein